MIHASPRPHIDVWMFQQDGAPGASARRQSLRVTFPDIYHSTLAGHAPAYGNGLVVNDRLQFGFVYPPLSLLLSTMGYVVAGDYRYAAALALVLAAAAIGYPRGGYAIAGMDLRAAFQNWRLHFCCLLPACFSFSRAAGLSLSCCCCSRRRSLLPDTRLHDTRRQGTRLAHASRGMNGIAAAAHCCWPWLWASDRCKAICHHRAASRFLLLAPGWRWRDWVYLAGRGFAVATAVTLPFALWNLPAYWKSVVRVQLMGPFRWDALSYLVWWGFYGHGAPQPSTAFLCSIFALSAGLGLCLWRAPRNPAGFSASFAFAFLLFLAFNKQAFANYYFS